MAQRTVRQLREDVTARIGALAGWKESLVAPDNFGRDADLSSGTWFVVQVSETQDLRAYRGKPAEGVLVESTLIVRYSWRLSPRDMSGTYDNALDGEQAVINKLMVYDATWPLSYKFQFTRVTRETNDVGEWVVGAVEFRVVHTLPLQ